MPPIPQQIIELLLIILFELLIYNPPSPIFVDVDECCICNLEIGFVVPIPTLPKYNKLIYGENILFPDNVVLVLFISELPISYLKLLLADEIAAYLTTPE